MASSISRSVRVLVTRHVPYITDRLKKLNISGLELVVYPESSKAISRGDLLKQVPGCHGILCMLTDTIDEEVLAHAGKQLKVVSTMSVGYNHINASACKSRGIRLGYTPGVLDISTAETAVALTFSVSRRVVECVDSARNGTWGVWQPMQYCGRDVTGSTVGIIGLGRIGMEYARMMKAFQCKIIYTARSRKEEAEKVLNAEYRTMEELLRESDIVSVHVPLTEQTTKLFGHKEFEMMKDTAILINTSRGPVVDQNALCEALSSNKIFGAGLDVTDPEPLNPSHPLFRLQNCVIFPHIGSATVKTREAMADIALRNLVAGLKDEPLPHEIL